MAKEIMLDTGPLGMITHPRPNPAIVDWFKQLLQAGVSFLIPEIADYEVRRELLRAGRHKGVERLDQLKDATSYVPLRTAAVLRAAEFWAKARNEGYPTADDKALDGDVILAAQAVIASDSGTTVVIATTNVGHLVRFADARRWNEIEKNDLL